MGSVTVAPAPKLHPADTYEKSNNKKMRCSFPLPQEVDDLASIPELAAANMLCEDELLQIFTNLYLSTKDLLNFRLVNKSWRDAATSTLLRRNACYIVVKTKTLFPDNGTSKESRTIFYQYRENKRIQTLAQLTVSMSKSPKFPVSNFNVYLNTGGSSFVYSEYPDLLEFFKLHGDKIRTLSSRAFIYLPSLVDMLSTYTPNIECLDLSRADPWRSKTIQDKPTENPFELTLKPIPLKSLILCDSSRSDPQNLHILLSSFPKLISIENVSIYALPLILKKGKGNLIPSFEYTISQSTSAESISALQQLAQVKPQLLGLKLNVEDSNVASSGATSELLHSCKGTLQKLDLYICPFEYQTRLKIGQMKNLKSIILTGQCSFKDAYRQGVDEDRAFCIFEFENGMSAAECFPSLAKLRLKNLSVQNNIMRFFQFKSFGDSLTKVQVLEILHSRLPTNFEPSLMSVFFPNLRVLKMNCRDFKDFESSFWTLFPSVELLEIYGISSSGYCDDVSSFSDKFFTGFSSEMCSKLRTTVLPGFLNHAEGLKFLRVAPSVCDMLHLKELKLKFSERLWTEFASSVTGIYAFSQMPSTKFIISYDQDAFKNKTGWYSVEGVDHEELCFASIKPYVQIVHEMDAEYADYC